MITRRRMPEMEPAGGFSPDMAGGDLMGLLSQLQSGSGPGPMSQAAGGVNKILQQALMRRRLPPVMTGGGLGQSALSNEGMR